LDEAVTYSRHLQSGANADLSDISQPGDKSIFNYIKVLITKLISEIQDAINAGFCGLLRQYLILRKGFY